MDRAAGSDRIVAKAVRTLLFRGLIRASVLEVGSAFSSKGENS